MRNKLPTQSSEVVGSFGVHMAYLLVSSGHLPLMNFTLFIAFLGEGFIARVAWVEKRFEAKHVEEVAVPVVKMARVLSFMVHLAAAAGHSAIGGGKARPNMYGATMPDPKKSNFIRCLSELRLWREEREGSRGGGRIDGTESWICLPRNMHWKGRYTLDSVKQLFGVKLIEI